MDEFAKRHKTPSWWQRNDLVTIGSAAVLTVYSAGYFRTQDAAQRFAGEAAQRHAAALSTKGPSVHAIAPPPEAVNEERGRLPRMRRVAATAESKPASGASGGSTSTAAAVVSQGTAPAAATLSAPPAAAPAPSEAPAPQQPAAAPPPAQDSAATTQPRKDEGDQLKDGVFYGWGTSRHGDIQASVEVKSGKIVGAYISQCLTRYSCSWISMLPPEVVQRQSAEVDYVSGATQSSNAFYYAIVEALKQAK